MTARCKPLHCWGRLAQRTALGALTVALAFQTVALAASDLAAIADRQPAINQILGSAESTMLELSTTAADDGTYRAQFTLDERPVTLELTPHSVRAPDFQVFVEGADGKLTEIDPGPVRTMRGRLLELPGSIVTGSLLPTGLDARIELSTGAAYGLTAVRRHIVDAEPQLHVLYDLAAVEEEGTCGTTSAAIEEPQRVRLGGVPCEPVGPFTARLGCDADPEFVASFPGTPAEELVAARQFIEDNVNEINVNIYELPPISTTHEIAQIILRDSSNDVYAGLTGTAVLNEMRRQWQTTHADANAHAINLWSGRDLHPQYIGLAYVGSMCNPGVCWVEKRFGNTRMNLLAHELGHVWGAGHCNEGPPGGPCSVCTSPCPIMRSFIVSCQGSFSQCSIDEILADRGGYECIDDPGFIDPTVLDEGVVVRDGSTNIFPTVLTGQGSTKLFHIRNNMNCVVPLRVRTIGSRFRVVEAPDELPANGLATFRLEFIASDFAGTYSGDLEITTPGLLSGYDLDVKLQATVGVGNNLPTAPQLICPLPWATTPQPQDIVFQWSRADFVESFEFQIRSNTDQVLFRETGLQQFILRPRKFTVTPGKSYLWVVIAHNVNGSARAASGFFVDPLNARPIMRSFYRNIEFPNNHTLNLPLNPSEFVFNFEFRNDGATSLRFDNIVIPADFGARWSADFGGGLGDGDPDQVKVNPCSVVRLQLRSTLTPAQLAQTNIIMDTLEFDTSDPDVPHFTLNLCFRCDPLACVGDPFSGCGTVTGVTQGGCYRFLADCGTEFGIQNDGSFGINDRIWVSGAVDLDAEFCFPHNPPRIPDAQIGTCVDDCGVLLEPLPCLVGPCYTRFRSLTTGAVYDIENIGPFTVGSEVHVTGGLRSYFGANFSGNPRGLIFGNTVDACGARYEALSR